MLVDFANEAINTFEKQNKSTEINSTNIMGSIHAASSGVAVRLNAIDCLESMFKGDYKRAEFVDGKFVIPK